MPTTTEQGEAALEEFGFVLVDLHQAGAPTPGRIADRLDDLVSELSKALEERNNAALQAGLARLRRLRLALDAYGTAMLPRQSGNNTKEV